jgi:hypothetical protein
MPLNINGIEINSTMIQINTYRDVPVNGLKLYADFAAPETYPGSGTAIGDISNNGNNGYFNIGTPTYSSTNGGRMQFDGTNTIVFPSLGSTYTYGTIMFWTLATAMVNYNNAFATHGLGSNVGFRWEENAAGTFGVVMGNDAGTYSAGQYIASGMAINTWYHVVLVWDASANTAVGYLNNSQVFNQSQTYWASTLPQPTMGAGFSASRLWQGYFGNTMIYNRKLSASEVSKIYNVQKERFGY